MSLNPEFIEDGGARDRELDVKRCVPIQCSYAEYLDFIAQGQNFAGELCETSDTHRLYKGAKFIGPIVYHGTVADQAAMLALFSTSDRKCERGDWCHRADQGGARWTCHANNGLLIGEWGQDTPASIIEGGAGQYFPVGNNDAGWVFDDDGNPVYEWFNYADL